MDVTPVKQMMVMLHDLTSHNIALLPFIVDRLRGIGPFTTTFPFRPLPSYSSTTHLIAHSHAQTLGPAKITALLAKADSQWRTLHAHHLVGKTFCSHPYCSDWLSSRLFSLVVCVHPAIVSCYRRKQSGLNTQPRTSMSIIIYNVMFKVDYLPRVYIHVNYFLDYIGIWDDSKSYLNW